MKKTDRKYKNIKFALNVAAPAVEIAVFVQMLKKSVKKAETDAEKINYNRKMPKWAIILNILLRIVLIVAYIDEYKKDKARVPINNIECEFWNFCDEDCSECVYYKNSTKHLSADENAHVDCGEDCAECNCNNING